MSTPSIHLLWGDGRTACNMEPAPTIRVTEDEPRVTCVRCRETIARGARGRSDRRRIVLSPERAPWPGGPVDPGARWTQAAGRYFKVWPELAGDRDTDWHVEEVTVEGDPAGHASLDPEHPGERRVVWVGGFYARTHRLDEAREVIRLEAGIPAPLERGVRPE